MAMPNEATHTRAGSPWRGGGQGRTGEKAVENINPCGNLWCVELKMKYNKMLYICSRNATKMLQAHKAEREREREGYRERERGSE